MRTILTLAAMVLSTSLALAQGTVPGGPEPRDPRDIPRLIVGDAAPGLSVTEWIKGGPVTLERGRVYVVDFWATWCVPCMKSMGHSSELSRAYRAKGVTFIALTAGDRNNTIEKVREVVAAKGEEMDFSVAFDAGRTSTEAWRDRARRNGIPVCFVIDRDGRLAWVGHPLKLDEPLAAIVAGTWDLAPARAAHAEAVEKHDAEIIAYSDYERARKEKRWEDAIRLADRVYEVSPHLPSVLGDKFEMMLVRLGDADRAEAYARQLLAEKDSPHAFMLGRIGGIIATAETPARRNLDLALECARRGVEAEPENPYMHNYLAKVHRARGELDKAIEAQQTAVRIAQRDPEELREMRAGLEELSGLRR